MKILNLLTVSLLMMLNIHAYQCEDSVVQGFENVNCLESAYIAKNKRDLAKYIKSLSSIKDSSNVKRLIIDFNLYSRRDISISSPCSITVKKNKSVVSMGNICFRAKDFKIQSKSKIYARKSLKLNTKEKIVTGMYSYIGASLINLESLKSIRIGQRALISSRGELNIKTYDKDYFDGHVTIARGARVYSKSIYVDSESSIFVRKYVKLKSGKTVLDAPSCNISKASFFSRKHRSFFSWFKRRKVLHHSYEGTCLNKLDGDFKILTEVNSEGLYDIQVKNLRDDLTLKYRINKEDEYSSDKVNYNFEYMGLHLVEAIVEDSSGRYQKLNKKVKISNKSYDYGTLIPFYFYNKRNRSHLVGKLNGKKIDLYSSPNSRKGLFYWISDGESDLKNKKISIDSSNYTGKISLYVPKEISNPRAYMESKIIAFKNSFSSLPSDSETIIKFDQRMLELINEYEQKLLTLSDKDIVKLINFINANTKNDESLTVSSFFRNFLIESTYASTAEERLNNCIALTRDPDAKKSYDGLTRSQCSSLIFAEKQIGSTIFAAGTVSVTGSVIVLGVGFLPSVTLAPWVAPSALGVAIVGAIAVRKGYERVVRADGAMYDIIEIISDEVIDTSNGALVPFPARGKIGAIISRNASTSKLNESYDLTTSTNTSLAKFNSAVGEINKSLSLLKFETQLSELDEIKRLGEERVSLIDSKPFSARIISSENGLATIDIVDTDEVYGFSINSDIDQEVQVRITYSDEYTGFVEKNVTVKIDVSTPTGNDIFDLKVCNTSDAARNDFNISYIDGQEMVKTASFSLNGSFLKDSSCECTVIKNVKRKTYMNFDIRGLRDSSFDSPHESILDDLLPYIEEVYLGTENADWEVIKGDVISFMTTWSDAVIIDGRQWYYFQALHDYPETGIARCTNQINIDN